MTEQAQHSLPVPLLLPTLAWCTGICLAAFLQIPIFWLILAGAAGIVTALIFRFRLLFLIVLFLIAGALRLSLAVNDKPNALRDLLQQKESITQPFTAEVKSVLRAHILFSKFAVRQSSSRQRKGILLLLQIFTTR